MAKDTDQNHLIIKKSWDIALGPIKQVNTNTNRFIFFVESKDEKLIVNLFLGTHESSYNVHVW